MQKLIYGEVFEKQLNKCYTSDEAIKEFYKKLGKTLENGTDVVRNKKRAKVVEIMENVIPQSKAEGVETTKEVIHIEGCICCNVDFMAIVRVLCSERDDVEGTYQICISKTEEKDMNFGPIEVTVGKVRDIQHEVLY